MRTEATRVANPLHPPSDDEAARVAQRRILTAKEGLEGGGSERLAIVMRHNAASLLLNRALFEFQGDLKKSV